MANENRDRVSIRSDADTGGTLVHTKDLDDFKLPKDEPDPRGWDVRGTDGSKVGKVEDLLFDTGERRIRYLEVALDKDFAKDAARDYALIPFGQARLDNDNDHVVLDLSSTDLAYADERYTARGSRVQSGAADRATRGGIADRVTDASRQCEGPHRRQPGVSSGTGPHRPADLADRDVAGAPSGHPQSHRSGSEVRLPIDHFERGGWSCVGELAGHCRTAEISRHETAPGPLPRRLRPLLRLREAQRRRPAREERVARRRGRRALPSRPAAHCPPGLRLRRLIASLIDCRAMATAAAASMEKGGATPGLDPTPRFVTASLQVDYLRPTPLGPELELRARATEVGERKVIVEVMLRANDSDCARGRVVAVRMPAGMAQRDVSRSTDARSID